MTHLLAVYLVVLVAALGFVSLASSNRSKNAHGWTQHASDLNDALHQDWVDVEEYHLDLVRRYAAAEDMVKCTELVRNRNEEALRNLDAFIFHTFFRRLRVQGVFLNILQSTASPLFFPKCFGWNGVVVNPEPPVSSYSEIVHVNKCLGSGPHCSSLKSILEDHASILGKQDVKLRFGTSINLVVVDLNGKEADLLACSDLHNMFSDDLRVQVWLVNTASLTEKQRTLMEAALLFAGIVPVAMPSQAMKQSETKYSAYVLLPSGPRNYPFGLSQQMCRPGPIPCSVAHMWNSQEDHASHGLLC